MDHYKKTAGKNQRISWKHRVSALIALILVFSTMVTMVFPETIGDDNGAVKAAPEIVLGAEGKEPSDKAADKEPEEAPPAEEKGDPKDDDDSGNDLGERIESKFGLKGVVYGADPVQNGPDQTDIDWVWTAKSDAADHRFTFSVTFALSGKMDLPAKTVEVTIPRHILKSRDGQFADYYDMSFPHESEATNDTPFVYKESVDENGNEILLIYNHLPLNEDAVAADFEVSYITTKKTFEYYDYDPSQSQEYEDASDPFWARLYIPTTDTLGNPYEIEDYAGPVSVYIDTTAVLSSTTKRYPTLYRDWKSYWTEDGKGYYINPKNGDWVEFDTDDYYYLLWEVESTVRKEVTQYYTFALNDDFSISKPVATADDDMLLIGYKFAGQTYYSSQNYVDGLSMDGVRYDWVLTAVKKETYDPVAPPEVYEEATASEWSVTNRIVAEVIPEDHVDKPSAAKSGEDFNYENHFIPTPGAFKLYKWGNINWKAGHDNPPALLKDYPDKYWDYSTYDLQKLQEGEIDSIDVMYVVNALGWPSEFTVPYGQDKEKPSNYWKAPVEYVLTDNTLRLQYEEINGSREGTNKGYLEKEMCEDSADAGKEVLLTKGDGDLLTSEQYRIKKVYFNEVIQDARYNDRTKQFDFYTGTFSNDSTDYCKEMMEPAEPDPQDPFGFIPRQRFYKGYDLQYDILNFYLEVDGEWVTTTEEITIYGKDGQPIGTEEIEVPALMATFNLATREFTVTPEGQNYISETKVRADINADGYGPYSTNAYGTYSSITFKNDVDVTGYQIRTINSHAYTNLISKPIVTLKNDDSVDENGNTVRGRLMKHVDWVLDPENSDGGTMYLFNEATHYTHTEYDGESDAIMADGSLKWFDGYMYASEVDKGTVFLSNESPQYVRMQSVFRDLNAPGSVYSRSYSYYESEWSRDALRASVADSRIKKKVTGAHNDTVEQEYVISWRVDMEETYKDGESRKYVTQDGGTFYDLIPAGGTVDASTIRVRNESKYLEEGTDYNVSVIPSYKGTGREMLVVRISTEGNTYAVFYDTVHPWDTINIFGNDVLNPVGYETGNSRIAEGYPDNGGNLSGGNKALYDDLDPDTDAERFIYAETRYDIDTVMASIAGLNKKVRNEIDDTRYKTKTYTKPGELYSYQLRYANSNKTSSRDIIFYDSLENYAWGENHQYPSDWRGTLENIDVMPLVKLGIDVKVYISKQENLDIESHRDLTDGSVWTLVREEDWHNAAVLGEAKAIAFDLRKDKDDKDFTLESGGVLLAYLYMRAPLSAQRVSGITYPETYNNIYLSSTLINTLHESESYFIRQDYTIVYFRVTADVRIYKANANDTTKPVKGIVFTLYGTSEYGTEYRIDENTRKTDSKGNASWEGMEAGEYILKEYSYDPDWVEDHTEHRVVIASDADGKIKVTIDGEETNETSYTITNKPRVHKDIEFYKRDLYNKSGAVEGITFKLSGTSDYDPETLITRVSTSDADGKVMFKDIAQGVYTLTEISCSNPNYIVSKNKWTVTVSEDGNYTITGNNVDTYLRPYRIYNEPLHKVELLKLDAYNNEPIERVRFTLKGTSDYGTPVDMEIETGTDGRAEFTGLEPGTYLLRETYTNEDKYVLNSTDYVVTVKDTGNPRTDVTITGLSRNNSGIFEFFNQRKGGKVIITKKWVGDSPLMRPTGMKDPLVTIQVKGDDDVSKAVWAYDAWASVIGPNNSIRDYKGATRLYLIGKGSGTSRFTYQIKSFSRNTELTEEEVKAKSGVLRMDKNYSDPNAEYRIYAWREAAENNLYDYYWWSNADVTCLDGLVNQMFKDCEKVEYVDLAGIDTSDHENFRHFFENCKKLTEIRNMINLSSAKYIEYMFSGDELITRIDTSTLNGENVTGIAYLFNGCKSLEYVDLSPLKRSIRISNQASAFRDCAKLEVIDLSGIKFTQYTTDGGFAPMYMSDAPDNRDFSYMFAGCTNLKTIIFGTFDTRRAVTMQAMFEGCSSLQSIDVSSFDVRNVTNMRCMFKGTTSLTSLDLSSFDPQSLELAGGMFYRTGVTELDLSNFYTPKLTEMVFTTSKWPRTSQIFGMFEGTKLKTLDLSALDTSKVTVMSQLFRNMEQLETLEIGNLDTSNVNDFARMFQYCRKLKNIKLCNFDTSKGEYFQDMFYLCESLEALNVSSFDTSNAKLIFGMFGGCKALTFLKIDTFETSSLYTSIPSDDKYYQEDRDYVGFYDLFYDCQSIKEIDISGLDGSNVREFRQMFYNCYALETLDLSTLNTSSGTSFRDMFGNCRSLKTLDLSTMDTSSGTDFTEMFSGCTSLETLDLSTFNTSSATTLSSIFRGCTSLETIDLSYLNTSNVQAFGYMFSGCTSLESLDLSTIDFSSATNIGYMFKNCTSLENLDLRCMESAFRSDGVTGLLNVFEGCKNLLTLDLSTWDTQYVTYTQYMFQNCESLNTIYVSDKWNLDNVSPSQSNNASRAMFKGCTSLVGKSEDGGSGFAYVYAEDERHDNNTKVYALYYRPDRNGYLTYKAYVKFNTVARTPLKPLKQLSPLKIVEPVVCDLERGALHISIDGPQYAPANKAASFTVTVTNTSDVNISNVVYTEDLTGSSWTAETLSPGQSVSQTFSCPVTEEDLADGYFRFFSNVSGEWTKSGETETHTYETQASKLVYVEERYIEGMVNVPFYVVWNDVDATKRSNDTYNAIEVTLYRDNKRTDSSYQLYRSNMTVMAEDDHVWKRVFRLPAGHDYTFKVTRITKDYMKQSFDGNQEEGFVLRLAQNIYRTRDNNQGYWIDNGDDTWTFIFNVADDTVEYKVWEGDSSSATGWEKNYTIDHRVSDPTYTLDQRATIVNDAGLKTGSLAITKQVEGGDPDDKEYVFTITLIAPTLKRPGATVTQQTYWQNFLYGTHVFDGVVFQSVSSNYSTVAKVTLKAGETKVISGIPIGGGYGMFSGPKYDIKEEESSTYDSVIINGTGTVNADPYVDVEVEPDGTVSMTMDGTAITSYAQDGDRYTFTVAGKTVTVEVLRSEDGAVEDVTLTHDGKTVHGVKRNSGAFSLKESIPDPETTKVVCINTPVTPPTGSFTVKKETDGSDALSDKEFTFYTELYDLTEKASYNILDKNGDIIETYTSDSDGRAFVTLKLRDGDIAKFDKLPVGASYAVTEEGGAYTASFEITSDNEDSVIELPSGSTDKEYTDLGTWYEYVDFENEEKVITFRNRSIPQPADLKIRKVVVKGSTTEAYSVRIDFTGLKPNATYDSTHGAVIAGSDGTASKTFFLEHDETAEFHELPVGATYQVTELANRAVASYTVEDESSAGEIVSASGANAAALNPLATEVETIEDGEKVTVTFFNSIEDDIPNEVSVSVPVEKVVKDSDGNAYETEEEFTFWIEAVTEGAPMPEDASGKAVTEVSVTGSGKANFGNITYDKAGTYEYTVSEVKGKDLNFTYSEAVYKVRVTVYTDENGKLALNRVIFDAETQIEGADILFENIYSYIEINGTKTWDDDYDKEEMRPKSINVSLLADGNVVTIVKVTADNDWNYSFKKLPKYDGTREIKYAVEEEPVEFYKAEVTGYDIRNTYVPPTLTEHTVLKVWDDSYDKEKQRPESIEVQLYANGKPVGETVKLNSGNGWTYTWTDLPDRENGAAIIYTAEETAVPEGYNVSVKTEDGRTVITNSSIPRTSDSSHMGVHMLTMFLSLAAIAGVLILKKKMEQSESEER